MKTLRSVSLFLALVIAAVAIFFTTVPLAQAQLYQWENFAGSNGGFGDRNASGSAARFYLPNGTVVAADGNIYVSDTSNFTIRQVTPSGAVTTFAGLAGVPGHINAVGSLARFSAPNGMAADGLGNLFVSDGTTIRMITTGVIPGNVTPLAGAPFTPGQVDGPPGVGLLFSPSGLAAKADGSLVFVADHGTHTIRQITVATGAVVTIAGGAGLPGSVDNLIGTSARFSNPTGLALSADETTLFVADTSNKVIRTVSVTVAGFPVNTVAGMPGSFGIDDGVGPAARFNGPTAIALNPTGTALAIVDSGNALIRVMLLSNFQVNTLAGTPLTNGSRDASAADLAFGMKAKFSFNTTTGGTNGATYQSNGNLIIADSANHTLRQLSPVAHVTTFAGRANEADFAHGVGGRARFSHPAGLAHENNAVGRVIVADSWNHVTRGIGPSGTTGLLSGSVGIVGTTGAEHYYPSGVAVDSIGRTLIADTYNSRIIRLLPNGTPDVGFNWLGGFGPGGLPGSAIIGIAGTASNTDGPLNLATFAYPEGVAEDPTNGAIYVADTSNHTIRKIDLLAGLVSTIGGAVATPNSTDGPGPLSRFNAPTSLAVDSAGVIYVSDTMNNKIRRMTPDGSGGFVVDTLAGSGNTFFSDGVGVAASFYYPRGIALDGAGNLYVADSYNCVVRRIVIAIAAVTTIGGRVSSSGNQGGLGPEAMFYQPHGIAAKPDGTLFLSTVHSNGIFIGAPDLTLPPTLTQPASNSVIHSPITVEFTLPEAALGGSVKLSFGANVFTLSAGQESAGVHSFSFDPANPLGSPAIAVGAPIVDGVYTVTLSYQDTAGHLPASADSIDVTVAATPFSQWKIAQHGQLVADLADLDGDGHLELMEYALLMDPKMFSTPPSAGLFTYVEGDRLRMFVPRDPAHFDITVHVEVTGDLIAGPWTPVATSSLGAPFAGPGYVGGDAAAAGVKLVEVRDIVNIPAATMRWMRVRVTH